MGRICVPPTAPPKLICGSPNPQCDGRRRQDLWEVFRFRLGPENEPITMGFVSLKERKRERDR